AQDHALAPAAARYQARVQIQRAQHPAAALAAREQAVDEHSQHALERHSGARVADLERLEQALLHPPRRERIILSARETVGLDARRAEAVGERIAPQAREHAERAHAEALQRLEQRLGPRAIAEQLDRPAREPAPRIALVD